MAVAEGLCVSLVRGILLQGKERGIVWGGGKVEGMCLVCGWFRSAVL